MSTASRTPVKNPKQTKAKLRLLRSASVDSRREGQGYAAAKANIRHWGSSRDVVCLLCKTPPMFPLLTGDGDKEKRT